jgi:hypothetical protein
MYGQFMDPQLRHRVASSESISLLSRRCGSEAVATPLWARSGHALSPR